VPLVVFHSRRVRDALKQPEAWGADVFFLLLIAAVVGGLTTLAGQVSAPFHEQLEINLSPWALPKYTLLSLGRGFAAYGLSRPGSLFHRPLLFVVLLTFLFGPGIIPSYLVVNALGLIDHYASLILPAAISAFNLIVMRSFFMGIPSELIDSARIDGAGEFAILRRIVLPLSKAVVAVVGLFYAVGFWNAFFNALLYLNDTSKWPVQVILRTYVLQGKSLSADQLGVHPPPQPQSLQMAVVVVALVPIAMVYPFLQRHFTKGVITGAVKG